MDGFCLLYLLLILLMRSGDIETNPGPNTAVSTVSEMEFLKLAQAIHPSYYEAVGISLGIPIAQLENILIQKLNNYTRAFLCVFMKWNVMQQPPHSNKRQLLADKLREIDLGGLSDRLLNEPPIPNSTGGPSRLLESQTEPPLAGSQTKPLSPELVERCANDFKFKYRSTLCKIRADPLDPASIVQFKDMYTNLFLQEEHGKEKRELDYNDILDLKVNGEFPKRIMVQGEAGAGKTTFCAKIAWDWIEGRHFSHFVWVLIVPLREFKQHTIGEIAKSYLAQNNPATVSQITDYIRSNPDKVFIAFDGLDEVSGKLIKTESCESQPTDQMQLQPSQPSVNSSEARGSSSETGDIGLVDILRSDQLASCPVLVTTRPWRAVEIRSDRDLMKLYTFIHVEGFNRENLSVYIHKYFLKNEDKANRLIQFTSENDVISEIMAHYPIYVAMLCLMWKELDEQKLKEMKSLKTFSQIFKTMIAFLKEHYAQKMVQKVGSPSLLAYLKKIDELLGPIAKQALNGLLENTLVFSEDDFEICRESKDTACRVGILSQEDRITSSIDIHKRNSHVQLPVFFPHKLFQEYMAGVHLASLYESDHDEFNRLIEEVVLPRGKEFRYLLYSTVSQNKSIATHVMKSMLQRISIFMIRVGSQEWIDFIVDVTFESQDPDVAALMKDRFSSLEIEVTIPAYMAAHTVAGYAFIGQHVVGLCIMRDCGPTMSLDVAEMILCSLSSLKNASLKVSAFHQCFFETLARKGKESKVDILKLYGDKCPTPASSHHLAEALCSMPNLNDLELGSHLTEEFYSTLKAKASSIQVEILKLQGVDCTTPASSHHLAEALCSMPTLNDLELGSHLTEEFYSTLKAKASSIQVEILKLDGNECPTPASSHHLAEALCSMPNLNDLTLMMDLTKEFYSTLKAKASSIQVEILKLYGNKCHTPASSHHLAEALCSMPNLNDLELGSHLTKEFYSTLKAKASSIQVEILKLDGNECPTPASSHHLAEALCSMPNLNDLTLMMDLTKEFYSTLKAKASSIQVEILKLQGVDCTTPASSHHLAEALCSMPNLNDLALITHLTEEFYSTLKAKASSIQVEILKLDSVSFTTPASSHHLAEALCSMPNLNDLAIEMHLSEEFFSTLKAKASSIQVETLELHGVDCTTPASSHHLAEALCSMPNLNDLELESHLTEEFFSTLKAKASSIQGCFPQIRKGNFRFNGAAQDDLDSFLHALTRFQEPPVRCLIGAEYQARGSDHGNTYNTRNVSSEQSRAMYQETMASTCRVNPVHANISFTSDTLPRVIVGPPLQQPRTLRTQSGFWPIYSENNALLGNPEPSQPQYMPPNRPSGMSAGYHTPAPNQPFSGYYCSPEYREAYYNPTYHATMSSSAPSPNPSVSRHDQPTMSAGYFSPTQFQPLVPDSTGSTFNIMPWSSQDHYTQSYHASTSSSALLCNPQVSGYHQPAMSRRHISDTPYQPMIVEQSGSSRPQLSQDHSTAGFHSASRDHPIVQERTSSSCRPGFSSQVLHSTSFSSRIQSKSSTGRDQDFHVGNTSDTVCQFSQTHREGSSSRSRPYKRQATCTQSRVPQDDPEIPEKQSKYV